MIACGIPLNGAFFVPALTILFVLAVIWHRWRQAIIDRREELSKRKLAESEAMRFLGLIDAEMPYLPEELERLLARNPLIRRHAGESLLRDRVVSATMPSRSRNSKPERPKIGQGSRWIHG